MAMKENVIKTKSFQFAVNTVNLYKEIQLKKHEFVLSKQFVRCGTSIGANIREGINAESKPDFIHKIKLAAKEADETEYWLLLCKNSPSYPFEEKLLTDVRELIKILSKIISTSKS